MIQTLGANGLILERFTKVILVAVGLVNFFPVIGLASAERLASLYGIQPPGEDLLILLQHRALLFGVLGGFIICSAFRPHLRRAAVTVGFISMVGFIAVLFASGGYGAKLWNVAMIDAVASMVLAVAAVSVFRDSSGT